MKPPRFCGLDIGLSTTDAVAEWAEDRPVSLTTGDPQRTAEAVLGQLLDFAPPPDGSPVIIAATGFGSHRLGDRLGDWAVRKVPELQAIGLGGTRGSGLPEGLVVSLGTGTAMVSVRGREIHHVSPGTGVGGGTLLGFARAILGVGDLAALAELAGRGNRSRVDVTIGEAAGGPLGTLPAEATASNLGKCPDAIDRADLAASLVNLVTEVVLSVTFLGIQASGHRHAILTGKLLLFEPIRRRIAEVTASMGTLFVIPEGGEIATARGALWSAQAGLFS